MNSNTKKLKLAPARREESKPKSRQLLCYYRDCGIEETIGNESRSYLGTSESARPKARKVRAAVVRPMTVARPAVSDKRVRPNWIAAPGCAELAMADEVVPAGVTGNVAASCNTLAPRSVIANSAQPGAAIQLESGSNHAHGHLRTSVDMQKPSPEVVPDNSINPTKLQALTEAASQPTTTQDEAEVAARRLADISSTREELKAAVQLFQGCPLKFTAMNTVFSDGNPAAKVMLIGEAPGANEDLRGIPFCGESGQLLDKVLATIGLTRQDSLYISNVVFWRPPANRKPTDNELRSCLPFVERHIAIINPDLLILAGSVALSSIFPECGTISSCRQKVMQYRNRYLTADIPTVAIFHPSYLLRQPLQKKSAWLDMIFIAGQLER